MPDVSSKPSASTRPLAGGVAAPVETTSATALPGATFPLAGLWLITLPDATVALLCVVTAPSVRPALVMAVVAAACVWPTTFGTRAPSETTTATWLPGAALLPPAGDWVAIVPIGAEVLLALVTSATRPAALIAEVAAAWLRPTTLGTVTVTTLFTLTTTPADVVAWPAASRAMAVSVWLPLATVDVVHVT